tara:strand:- start:84 stop:320 length:237 start_codon:yes stop_codon:yes gene_type:complete
MSKLKWIWGKIKFLISFFQSKYKVTVSFNKEYGDSDDITYVTQKIIVQKENHLKFRDENRKVIEYQSAGGLNYIIEEL